MHRNPAVVCACPKPGRRRRVRRQEGHPACRKHRLKPHDEPRLNCGTRPTRAWHGQRTLNGDDDDDDDDDEDRNNNFMPFQPRILNICNLMNAVLSKAATV